MASVSLAGTVTGKPDKPAVELRTFDNGMQVAKFSVADREYFYSKDPEKKGQFYSVEVSGKAAEFCVDRLNRGDKVAVTGQLVQRDYEGRTFLDVKQARVTFLENKPQEGRDPF